MTTEATPGALGSNAGLGPAKLADEIAAIGADVPMPAWDEVPPLGTTHLSLWADVQKLRAFARGCLDDWPDVGMDGFDLQNLAVKTGLLAAHAVTEPCGENCACIEYHGIDGFSDGAVCYRKTALLKGPNVRGKAAPTA